MKQICQTKILENKQLAEKYWKLSFLCPDIAKAAKPGTFIEVYFRNSVKLFPRPFSIANATDDAVELIYKVVGTQTEKMTHWKAGEKKEILGPLGNTFTIEDNIKTHILVGGGVGLAPMVFLSKELERQHANYVFFSGGRNDKEFFPNLGDKVYISTDDGSRGFHGNVVQNLKKKIRYFPKPSVIYACGPEKMSEAVNEFAKKQQIPTQISMETLMACGMGLCQGCAIKIYDKTGKDKISLVCTDGPVFKGEDINFG